MSAKDYYYQYYFGWRHGAGGQCMDKKRSEHADNKMKELYLEGFWQGRSVARRMGKRVAKIFGAEIAVIKTMESK